MWLHRTLLSAVLVVVALVAQVSILARLGLPGAVPDLLLLVVLGLALVYGPVGGCLIGFCAGLLADLAPPSDHAVGRYALVLCILGYVAGMLRRPEGGQIRSVFTPLLVVAGAAFTATLLYAAVGALVGDTAARHVGIGSLLVTAVLYDVLLAPFVVPVVMALARRSVTEPVSSGGTVGTGGGPRRQRRTGLNRKGSIFGEGGSRTGGIAGLGTVPGFGGGPRGGGPVPGGVREAELGSGGSTSGGAGPRRSGGLPGLGSGGARFGLRRLGGLGGMTLGSARPDGVKSGTAKSDGVKADGVKSDSVNSGTGTKQ